MDSIIIDSFSPNGQYPNVRGINNSNYAIATESHSYDYDSFNKSYLLEIHSISNNQYSTTDFEEFFITNGYTDVVSIRVQDLNDNGKAFGWVEFEPGAGSENTSFIYDINTGELKLYSEMLESGEIVLPKSYTFNIHGLAEDDTLYGSYYIDLGPTTWSPPQPGLLVK